MTRPFTLCIVGAGSSYTPELLHGLLARPEAELPARAIHLNDSDPDRLATMAALAGRMVRHARREVTITSDTRLEPMLDGADFVVTQIRVGGMAARHLDETIPLRYGIIGQETTGPGGMCKALRTIPPMLDIARAVERICPAAFILNYTNPSGIITEAVRTHTRARLIGLCSGIPGIQARLAERLRGRYPDLRSYCVGLNHFGFVHRMLAGGRDVTGEAIDWLAAEDRRTGADEAALAESALARFLGAVPIGYVNYYLHRQQAIARVRALPETRAQTVMKIEREVLAQAADPASIGKPAALGARGGGGYADITFAVLHAILHDTGAELAASVPSAGCVSGIPAAAVAEVVCRVDGRGATPLPVGDIPLPFRGLVQAIKAYETLTVQAAVTRSRRQAAYALMNHPLVGDLDVVEPLLDEMLAAHGLSLE